MMKFDLLFVQTVVVSIVLLVIVNVADPVNFVTGKLQDDNNDNHRHREIEHQHHQDHHHRYLRETASTSTSISTSRDKTENDVPGVQQRGLQQGIEGVVLIRSSLCPLKMDSLEMGANCIDSTRTVTTSTSSTPRSTRNRRQVINGDDESPVVHCGYDYVWMGGCSSTSSTTTDDEEDEDEEEEDAELHCAPRLNCVCDLFGDGTWVCQTTADMSGVDCSDGTKAPTDRGQSCPSSKQEQELQEIIIMLSGGDNKNKNNVDNDSLLSIDDKDDVATSTIPATENEDGNNNNNDNDDIMQFVSGDNPDADDDYQVKGLVFHASGGGVVDDNDNDDDLSISSDDEDDIKDVTEAIEQKDNDNDVSTSATIITTENEDGNDKNDDGIQIVSGDNPEADDDYKVEVSYVDATVVVVDDDDDDDTNSMSVVSDSEGDDIIPIVSGDNPELDDDYRVEVVYEDVISGDDNNSCQTIPELLCGEGSSVEKFTTVCDLWSKNFPDSNDKKTMTLFAPTDQAFHLMDELFSKGDNYSLSDEEYLEVFQFHVVPGRTVLFENLLCGELLEMSTSKKFSSFTKCNIDTDGTISAKFQRGGGNRKNNIEPMITTSDIRACHDSVIHIINEVMLPNFIDQLI